MRHYCFLSLAALAGLALLVSCNQEENKEILSRLDTLENVTIVSIQGQMTAINGTLGTLQGTQAQLSGYVTSLQTAVGELQGDYAGLQSMVNSLKDKDDAFAEELVELKDYVDQCDGDVKAWVEQAYTSLEKFNGLQSTVSGISTSITTIIGRLNALDTSTQKIANDLQTATETLTNSLGQCREEIEGIKTDLRNLQDDMDSLREQMAAIVSAVQSVVVVPDYSDGSVKMTDGESNELRFEVYPLEAASNLAVLGVSALSLDCVETETKSDLFTNIPLKSVTFDGEVLRVVADGSSLPAAVKVGDTAVNARLRISDGTVTRSSEYFFMTYKVADVPIAVTGESSDIGETSAKLYGWCNLESTDGTPVVFGFEYSDRDLTFNANTVIIHERDEENKYSGIISHLSSVTRYYYRAFTICDGVRTYGEVMSFTTLEMNYEWWEDVPEVVDLGLSVKWRSWNVGASAPEEYGDYFAWGEIESKNDDYSESTYKWCNGTTYKLTRYCHYWASDYWDGEGDPDDKMEFKDYDYADDAARAVLGSPWRMPTEAEFQELVDNCEVTNVVLFGIDGYGVNGLKLTSKKTGYTDNKIFLPMAGVKYRSLFYNAGVDGSYWISSLQPFNTPDVASCIMFSFGGVPPYEIGYTMRYCGVSVRPVCE